MPPNAIPQEVDALMFLRPLIATVLGALLGYEQERAGKPLASAPTDGVFRRGVVRRRLAALLWRRWRPGAG